MSIKKFVIVRMQEIDIYSEVDDYSVEPSLMKFGEKIFLKILEIYLKSMVTKEHIGNNGELYLLIDMAFLFS